jgi:hypothetical protein
MDQYRVRRGEAQPFAGNEQHRQRGLNAEDRHRHLMDDAGQTDLSREELDLLSRLFWSNDVADSARRDALALRSACLEARENGRTISFSARGKILELLRCARSSQ